MNKFASTISLVNITATVAVIVPVSMVFRVVTLEGCLLAVAVILFYAVVRYFDQKEPVSDAQLRELRVEFEEMKKKVGYISVKVGFDR